MGQLTPLRYHWPLAAVLSILAAVAIILLLPGGEPCKVLDGLHFETIRPRPGHCPSPEMGE